jgi:hypothetical protein
VFNLSGKSIIVAGKLIGAGKPLPGKVAAEELARLVAAGVVGEKPTQVQPKTQAAPKPVPTIRTPPKAIDLLDPEHLVPRRTEYTGGVDNADAALARAKRAARGE